MVFTHTSENLSIFFAGVKQSNSSIIYPKEMYLEIAQIHQFTPNVHLHFHASCVLTF